MALRVHTILILLLLSACTGKNTRSVEKWTLHSFIGQPFCSLSPDPPDSTEYRNCIVDTFLGIEDSVDMQTQLHLYEDGKFSIIKKDQPAFTGQWIIKDHTHLLLSSEDRAWDLEIMNHNADSLLLRADAYPALTDVHITLKH